jgi:hypothetical protein
VEHVGCALVLKLQPLHHFLHGFQAARLATFRVGALLVGVPRRGLGLGGALLALQTHHFQPLLFHLPSSVANELSKQIILKKNPHTHMAKKTHPTE